MNRNKFELAKKTYLIAAWVLFLIYCAVMLWLLFFGRRILIYPNQTYFDCLRYNLVPFRTVESYVRFFDRGLYWIAVKNLVGNIVMFVPYGFFLPCLSQKLRKFPKCLLCIALTIIAVELLQMFTLLGSCDIDDFILNTVGASVGFFLWSASSRIYERLTAKRD